MGIEIRDVRVICTAPEGISLVVVKVLTNEPDAIIKVDTEG